MTEKNRLIQRAAKRVLDIAVAAAGLVLLSPLMLAIAGAVGASLGRPLLFRQERPGRHGRPFTLYKFRTMSEAKDADGRPLPDRERLNRVGRFLRRTSLDELPELYNVLIGDMSLVGPRPLLTEYLPLYTEEQARRHEVRPGLTGWAQVNGRNEVEWEERFRMDVWYVDHWNLLLDAKILVKTVGEVVGRSGISRPGHATMTRFTGQEPSTGRDGADG